MTREVMQDCLWIYEDYPVEVEAGEYKAFTIPDWVWNGFDREFVKLAQKYCNLRSFTPTHLRVGLLINEEGKK